MQIETWLMSKVSRAISGYTVDRDHFRRRHRQTSGNLEPNSGIQVCTPAPGTAAGTFTWQDLFSLAWSVPSQFHRGASFLMNQKTASYCFTLSDAIGRPLMVASPTDPAKLMIAGFPLTIVTQMPDPNPGAICVAFGQWDQAYRVVYRKPVSMLVDNFSGGFCPIFKFDARMNGMTVCPNAAKLLRMV